MTLDLHTYREIRQQPRVWLAAYEIVRSRQAEISRFVNHFKQEGYQLVLTGAGTSAYIGDALEPALFSTPFSGARAIATTDIITEPENYFNAGSKVLLISFARSGNSPESVGAVRAVEKTAGAVAHVFITCNPQGQLALMKGDNILTVLLPPETNDLSLAMTSSYSTMLLVCSLIANIDKLDEQEAHVKALSACVGAAMDRYEAAIKAIAGIDFKRAVFLGSGPLKGVAEESRLKLQELTDGSVMCAFDSFLGFRHGPKAVVHDDTLLVYLLSAKPHVQRYELDLVRQIKEKGGNKGSVLVCQQKPAALPAGCEGNLCVEIGMPENVPACYACVSYIFVAQLLGMFKSMDLGLCPDTPSVSGNISRVVEGVILYD